MTTIYVIEEIDDGYHGSATLGWTTDEDEAREFVAAYLGPVCKECGDRATAFYRPVTELPKRPSHATMDACPR